MKLKSADLFWVTKTTMSSLDGEKGKKHQFYYFQFKLENSSNRLCVSSEVICLSAMF